MACIGCTSSNPGDGQPPCVAGLVVDCKLQYDPPEFKVIFDKILHPTCASGRGSCHTSDAAKGGLVFEEIEVSYRQLLDKGTVRPRVIPGDPACSLLVSRLKSVDPNTHMPPGPVSLSDGETCTIVQWIARGAKR
ncbi:MAG: hypothetical protein NVSMB1_26970 [Polyangiales bacterium]